MKLTFGSAFSGIGGFDLGFERAGMQCRWQIEIDPKARAVLKRHWPQVPQLEDITHVQRAHVSPVDVLCGGFPCQDVSVAGTRAGLAGERSGLWFQFSRLIGELKPRWVVIENVPGLLTSNDGRDFATVLRGLVNWGYGVSWRVLDAQYFGLAQRRERVFIVASLGSGRSAKVLFEQESSVRHSPAGRGAKQATAAVAGIRLKTYSESGFERWVDNGGINSTLAAHSSKEAHDLIVFTPPTVTGTLSASGAGTARTGNERSEASFLIPTSIGIRRLTPLECERLQGFPDNWTAGQSDIARYKQCGNAVAVTVAEWVGRRLMLADQA
jgi:DNA (cytosine-5)-methyltransferase 1